MFQFQLSYFGEFNQKSQLFQTAISKLFQLTAFRSRLGHQRDLAVIEIPQNGGRVLRHLAFSAPPRKKNTKRKSRGKQKGGGVKWAGDKSNLILMWA